MHVRFPYCWVILLATGWTNDAIDAPSAAGEDTPKRVLFVENPDHRGQFDHICQTIRSGGFDVAVRPADKLADLQAGLRTYATIILANVPRFWSSGGELPDEQIKAIVANTRKNGRGLVLLGGFSSLGAGGWINTELEKASPVGFRADGAPPGGLVLVFDVRGQGEDANVYRSLARHATDQLAPSDYVGVILQNGKTRWLGDAKGGLVKAVEFPEAVARQLDKLTSLNKVSDLDAALQKALSAFEAFDSIKKRHVVLFSDGQATRLPRRLEKTLAKYQRLKTTISTVDVGATSGGDALTKMAHKTGGKYYKVVRRTERVLLSIGQRESLRTKGPAVYLAPKGKAIRVKVVQRDHPILAGIERIPPIQGLLRTKPKPDKSVKILLAASRLEVKPATPPILVTWHHGRGRVVVLTTDAGGRWSESWTKDGTGGKLLRQMVLWSTSMAASP